MERVLVRFSISCVLGLFSLQAFGADRPVLSGGYQRDCSKMADAKRKARCEEANKAMNVCSGKKAGDELTNCLKEQRKAKK